MDTFMVVATFREGIDLAELAPVIPDEQARVAALRQEQRLGAIHVSMPRRVVFIETFAEDAQAAADTVSTLPLARWWDADVFPTTVPAIPAEH